MTALRRCGADALARWSGPAPGSGLANQLRDQLARFWPGAGKVFCAVDSPIALAFLRRYPSPGPRTRSGRAATRRVPQTPRLPRSQTSARARLRNGAEGRAGELETVAHRQIVLAMVSALEPIVAASANQRSRSATRSTTHPDGEIFRSLFIAPDAWLCAATMLAEIGDCRDRYPSYRALAADAGQSPVADESGKVPPRAVPLGLRPPPTRSVQRPRRLKPTPQPLGQRHLHPRPATAVLATPTPPGSSAAPGARSSGASGTTTTPTTRPNTPP